MKRHLFIYMLCFCCLGLKAQQKASLNPATDWLSEAKLGVFMHFLPNRATFQEVDSFDVEALATQLSDAGVKYFVFTLGQNSGYFNAPNPVYDRLTGYSQGERCALRDLPMEIAKALKRRGIRFMLYLPCQPPITDTTAVKAFGFPLLPLNDNRQITEVGARNWARVIAYWSRHYGKLVSGWWFDGGYSHCGFNSTVAKFYAKAAKTGNRRAITAFNPGVINPNRTPKHPTEADDYIAGEINEPFQYQPMGRWQEGKQMHLLTYMGSTWGKPDVRFTDAEWITWLQRVTSQGIAVTFDMAVNYLPEKGKVGSLFPLQLQQLKHLYAAILP